ncbi:uncharacterized protein LOC128963482 [Oppia nitens]|uniref:uncharacterized protein LOC128963482 n=1 Tax=Oppia nitens TaxID=1686743 RepID=UPI0023DB1A48|nr:uncharacterized protein LOC128963482 [Oppia nitens]
MSDKAIKETVKRAASLPQYLEVFDPNFTDDYADVKQRIPLISVQSTIDDVTNSKMTSTELRLRRWFKCTRFEDKCFATRNGSQQFIQHLVDKHNDHKLFCLYCSPISGSDSKNYFLHEDLVEHIRSEHCYRLFQCNLCLYRSITADHIVIHQQSVHSRNFEETIATNINNEEQPQLNGDEHKVSVNGDDKSVIKECKILECTQLAETEVPDVDYFYHKYRYKRLNSELNAHQCLYCPYMDTNKEELYAHSVAAHPDYPIMVYIGINTRRSVNGEKEDHELSEAKVKIKATKKRSFDESFSDSDITTNGVVDTYEFDIWTESDEEDMLLSEDDLSSVNNIQSTPASEPAPKRQKIDPDSTHNKSGVNDRTLTRRVTNRVLRQSYYLAAGVSAMMALYYSVVLMSGR